MVENDQLSSYPILRVGARDYVDAAFNVTAKNKGLVFDDLFITFEFNTENVEEIEQLIEEGKACYCINVISSQTMYSELYKTTGKYKTIKVPVKAVGDAVNIESYIMLTEDIVNFSAKAFNPLYGNHKFNLPRKQILAKGKSFEIKIPKKEGLIDNKDRIVKYKRLDNPDAQLTVDTSGEYIVIGLNQKIFDEMIMYGKSTLKNTMKSMAVIGPMVLVLSQVINVRQSANNEEYEDKLWFKSIVSLCEKNGYDLSSINVYDSEILTIAMKILQDPLNEAMEELQELMELEGSEEV